MFEGVEKEIEIGGKRMSRITIIDGSVEKEEPISADGNVWKYNVRITCIGTKQEMMQMFRAVAKGQMLIGIPSEDEDEDDEVD